MGSRDPRVDAYIAKAAPFARPVLTYIRAAVHAGCPDVEEGIKWGFPHFMHKGILCSMASFKAHCTFGFWKRSLVDAGPRGAKTDEAMGQFGRIAAVADLPGERALKALVRKAAALNDQGVKAPGPGKRAPTPAPAAPPDLLEALKGSAKARAAFDDFSASHRREYIEWISSAKRDETRQRRIDAAVRMMAEGKSQNWKYERTGRAVI
jgi:uncharacterized protein YdeI (YjbR/CyaY-like superfamily)